MKLFSLFLMLAVSAVAQTYGPVQYNTNNLNFTPRYALSSNMTAGANIAFNVITNGNVEISAPNVLPVYDGVGTLPYLQLSATNTVATPTTGVRFWNSNNIALYVRGTNGTDKLIASWP